MLRQLLCNFLAMTMIFQKLSGTIDLIAGSREIYYHRLLYEIPWSSHGMTFCYFSIHATTLAPPRYDKVICQFLQTQYQAWR
ncbi:MULTISPECIES: hypothetical protein [unclassified Rickettsia]|uniref:hypothetical protein n=1 Tax=unclassified Rickettsia TaxID=114295 RepID=UPI003132E400